MVLPTPEQRVLFFRTKIGWMGMATDGQCVQKLVFGCETRSEAANRFDLNRAVICKPNPTERDWIETLNVYATGEQADLKRIPIDLSRKTEFQLSVIHQCMEIPPGTTLSYGEVAAQAGSPKAARAVGTVMKQNNTPLIVPCHRVVSASGLGGFNNPRGVGMKVKLLALEGHLKFQQEFEACRSHL